MVHDPGDAVAALILLHDRARGGRAGPNSMWTRMARELAELGFVVLRFDYSRERDGFVIGRGLESSARPGLRVDLDLQLLREVGSWFWERVPGLELFVVGSCFGASTAVGWAREQPDVAGMFLVVPWLRTLQERLGEKDGGERDGDARPDGLSGRMVDAFDDALTHMPAWILVGEHELPDVQALRRALPQRAQRFDVVVVPGMALYPPHYPDTQAVVREHLMRRLERVVAAAPGSAA